MPRMNGSFKLKVAVAVLAATLLAGCATAEDPGLAVPCSVTT